MRPDALAQQNERLGRLLHISHLLGSREEQTIAVAFGSILCGKTESCTIAEGICGLLGCINLP